MADRIAWRICRDNQWWSVFGKKLGRTTKSGPPVHDDLVKKSSHLVRERRSRPRRLDQAAVWRRARSQWTPFTA